MGMSHSLDQEQMESLIDAMRETSSALVEIEGRTQAMEMYFKGVTTVQRHMSKNAQDCLETLESLNKIVDSKSEQANKGWKQFSADTNLHTTRASHILSNLKFDKLSKGVPTELAPMMVPIVLFTLTLFGFNTYFGYLLSIWEELDDVVDGTSILRGLLKFFVWIHLSLFVIMFLLLLREAGKQMAKKNYQAHQGSATIWTLMNDIVKQPFRTRYTTFAAHRRRLISRTGRHRPTFSKREIWRGRARAPTGDQCMFEDESTSPRGFMDSVPGGDSTTGGMPSHRPTSLWRIPKPFSLQRFTETSPRTSPQTPVAPGSSQCSSLPVRAPLHPRDPTRTRNTVVLDASAPVIKERRLTPEEEIPSSSRATTSRTPSVSFQLADKLFPSVENEVVWRPVHEVLAKYESRSFVDEY
eukprot:GEMP01027168.1.p1 GENE.GEMP01027168.1~~GEMP01027168.1.p1  ORF type:complete len:412 (+),score=73.18 GEMP01027168.1:323-1558(+)